MEGSRTRLSPGKWESTLTTGEATAILSLSHYKRGTFGITEEQDRGSRFFRFHYRDPSLSFMTADGLSWKGTLSSPEAR